MGDTRDIVERLRDSYRDDPRDRREAADEIESLRSRLRAIHGIATDWHSQDPILDCITEISKPVPEDDDG